MVHIDCCRPSDRVLGQSKNPGTEPYSELVDFDYNKWFTCLQGSQAVWNSDKASNAIKHMLLNSENIKERNGKYCIKVTLSDGGFHYVHERGKVQRYTETKAKVVLSELNGSLKKAIDDNNPLCYSVDGSVFGRRDDIQENSVVPIDLVECIEFSLVKYTRGISLKFDCVKNFYAPLVYFVSKRDDKEISFHGGMFLLTNPMDLKLYLKNWQDIGFILEDYRIGIIESDDDFDNMMLSCQKDGLTALVNPFFDSKKELMKGFIMGDMADLQNRQLKTKFLFIIDNGDDTFTYLYRDKDNDITLLLNDSCSCTCNECNCLGCQMYELESLFSINHKVNQRRVSDNAIVIEITDDSVWDPSFVSEKSVDWGEWSKIIGVTET